MWGDYRGVPPHIGRGLHEGRIPGPGEPSLNGIFAVNPIRRTATLIAVCLLVLGVVVLLLRGGGNRGDAVLLMAAALVGAILVLAVPLLLWSVAADLHRRYRRRTSPDLTDLRLSTRTENILRRAGYETVADIDGLDDDRLLALPRMEDHDVRQIRRALSLWTYRQWQESGFPTR
jgi:hypothetical protein